MTIGRTAAHALVRVLVAATLILLDLLGEPAAQGQVMPAAASVHTYRNPVFNRDFPDPMVLKVGRDYYAYGTSTDWEPMGHFFPVLHSIDLVHWRYVADALTSIPKPVWSYDDWWAPSVVASHGTYYLYYTGMSIQEDRHCIGVATASRPTGPFHHRTVIFCGDATASGAIDPSVLVDSTGHGYLYFAVDGPHHSISGLPLTRDLLHAAGPRVELLVVSQPWERASANSATVEGPWPMQRGTRYYLFYSGNDWNHDYKMGYATAGTPLGPFVKSPRNPILHGNAHVVGPGGGSVVVGPHGGDWLVYHAWTGGPGYGVGQEGIRTLRLDRLIWHGDDVRVAGPTLEQTSAP
jgi:beta-xylosidase